MKDSGTLYRRLTVVNSVVLLVGVVVLVAALAILRDPILRVLEGFMKAEMYSSTVISNVREMVSRKPKTASLPLYEIKIKPVYMREINKRSRELVEKGKMSKEDKIWFPAQFFFNGEKYKVNVRLRGDIRNHWIRAKKSWKIKFKKGNLFHGYKELSIIIPDDRQYEIEDVGLSFARETGLLIPDSGFSEVKINGVDYGLYFWYEEITKETLERQQYPEGEVFKDSDVWLDNYNFEKKTNNGGLPPENFESFSSFYHTKIQTKKVNVAVENRWRQFLRFVNKSDRDTFRENLKYFVNIPRFALWNAVAWAFGSTHAQLSHNVSWFYDTSTGLFEPLLFDLFIYPPRGWNNSSSTFENKAINSIVRRILSDHTVQKTRNSYLWEFMKDFDERIYKASKAGYAKIKPYLAKGANKKFLHRTDAQHQARLKLLKRVHAKLAQNLSFSRAFVESSVWLDENDPRITIRIIPDGMAEMRLQKLELMAPRPLLGSAGEYRVMFHRDGDKPREIPAKKISSGPEKLTFEFNDLRVWLERTEDLKLALTEWRMVLVTSSKDGSSLREAWADINIKLTFDNAVTGKRVPEYLVRHSRTAIAEKKERIGYPVQSIEAFLATTELPFIVNNRSLVLAKGSYAINRDLVVPGNYELVLKSGVTLKLGPDVSIVTYRPLRVEGTGEGPVRIEPGVANRPWGVIGVISADGPSRIDHLIIRGGSEAWIKGVFLSGQLCFYRSDVDINSLSISGANADDSLNIKSANFTIRDSKFFANRADGLDGDWVNGVIANTVFEDNGGDGTDFSGSKVLIRDSRFEGMGDKAVSAGEKSSVMVANTLIKNSLTGIASKDLSNVSVFASAFYQNATAMSLYRKKRIFGGGNAKVVSTVFWGNKSNFSVDRESRLELLGVALRSWVDTPGVTASDMRIGPVAKSYRDLGHAGIMYSGPETSMFSKGPNIKLETFLGFAPANPARHSIGMVKSLEVQR